MNELEPEDKEQPDQVIEWVIYNVFLMGYKLFHASH